MNQTKQQFSGSTNDSHSDALAIIGMLAIGILSVVVTLFILGNFLALLPPIFASAIAFSLVVFAVACGVALMTHKDTKLSTDKPPVLLFQKKKGRLA